MFFACDDAEGCGRIACVQADHDMAGRIAAELLSAQLSPGDAVLLCAGDAHTPSHYRMAAGFEAYLRENSVPLTLVRADGYHNKQELALRLRRTLAEDARISGAFSVSARLSVLLADAVAQMPATCSARLSATWRRALCRTFFIRTRRSRDIWLPGLWVISCCAGYSPRPASTTWKAV